MLREMALTLKDRRRSGLEEEEEAGVGFSRELGFVALVAVPRLEVDLKAAVAIFSEVSRDS